MAKEIKTLDIENQYEAEVIETLQHFGWTLKSSQRVFNQDTHAQGAISYQGITFVKNKTKTVDFTKLVFEREKAMPHYQEIVTLEQEYFNLLEQIPEKNDPPVELMLPFEEWATKKKKRPFVFPAKMMLLFGAGSFVLSFIVYSIVIMIINSGFSLGSLMQTSWFWGEALIVSVPLTYFFLRIANSFMYKKAYTTSDTPYHKVLKERYADYEKLTKTYARSQEILTRADIITNN